MIKGKTPFAWLILTHLQLHVLSFSTLPWDLATKL
jgi:hypothetical protein